MRKHVFICIVDTLSVDDRFFQQHPDACKRQGATALQKCTTTIRMVAYRCAADQIDEYLKLGATTSKECLAHFVDGVIAQFSATYLRKSTLDDLQHLLSEGEDRGFHGMIGSIDCMHWEWKNCPVGWKGMYQGRSRTATVILEALLQGIYGFGMLFLVHLVLATTSMYSNTLLVLILFLMVELHKYNSM